MKNLFWSTRSRFALGVCLASVLAVLVSDSRVCAQAGQGVYVTQAAARLTKLINEANKLQYKLTDNSFSVGGGWLKQSQTAWVPLFTVDLKAGKKYVFLAAGDNDAMDVDLEIQDSSGNVVATDTKTDPQAVVAFNPTKSGAYTVRVRLYDSQNNLPCMCLAIMLTK